MDAALGLFIFALVIGQYVAQFVVGNKLNSTRKQSDWWWVWVLILGWIGVIVIACQKPKQRFTIEELTAAVKERDALLAAENYKIAKYGLEKSH